MIVIAISYFSEIPIKQGKYTIDSLLKAAGQKKRPSYAGYGSKESEIMFVQQLLFDKNYVMVDGFLN